MKKIAGRDFLRNVYRPSAALFMSRRWNTFENPTAVSPPDETGTSPMIRFNKM